MMDARRIKRFLDIVSAVVGLTILSPVMLGVSVLIRATMGSPVLFRQTRPGLNCRLFKLFKFRTMTDERDAVGELLPDEQRLTRVGRFIRRTSLDELPQLINVLKGDMSMVGPRPLLVEYLPRYSCEQNRRHEVKPGITGWAQVNGRNALSWQEKFEHDVWYVDNWSLGLDFFILLKTVVKAVKGEGVRPEDREITDRFQGSEESDSARSDQGSERHGHHEA